MSWSVWSGFTGDAMTVLHPIPPVFDENSRILILGSFPSVRSREEGFYYGHPQNRFWKTLAGIFSSKLPSTVEQKRDLLLTHGIALWDVIASCEIVGSSDASIREAIPNDLSRITAHAPIRRIFTNGATAHKLYCKYLLPVTGIAAVQLPSTSPANAAWGQARLLHAWQAILEEGEMI